MQNLELGFNPDAVLASLTRRIDNDINVLNIVLSENGGNHDFPPDDKARMAMERMVTKSEHFEVSSSLQQTDREALNAAKRCFNMLYRIGIVIQLFGRVLDHLEHDQIQDIPHLLESIRREQRR